MKTKLQVIALLLGLAISYQASSQCSTTPFFSPSATVESFEGTPGTSGYYIPSYPYTFSSGVKVSTTGTLWVADWSKGHAGWGLCNTSTTAASVPHGTASLNLNDNVGTITFELPVASGKVGLWVEGAAPCVGSAVITLTAYSASGAVIGTCTTNATGNASNWKNNFIGFQSSSSNITKVTLKGPYNVMDKFTFEGGCTAQDWYLDADGDGFAASKVNQCNNPGAGYTSTVLPVNDCNDALVMYADADGDGFGSSIKVPCGGVNNSSDCDDAAVMYADADGDGFGSGVKVACGGVTNAIDCDDNLVMYADADGDGFGTNEKVACGGVTNSSDCDDAMVMYADADGDGFGSNLQVPCGGVTNSSDCDDNLVMYADADGDGFGSSTKVACGGVTNSSDCDDAMVRYADADGDGFGSSTKVACGGVTNSSDCDDATVRYADADGDGFGSTTKVACGGVINSSDCDDSKVLYQDNDNDGFGSTVKVACGGVINSSDCDDTKRTYADNDHDGYGAGAYTPCGVTNNYDADDTDGKPRIIICHKGQQLVIDHNAWQGHAGHGDVKGGCVGTAGRSQEPVVGASKFELMSTPNPVTNAASIRYTLPTQASVTIKLFDVNGREVANIFSGNKAAGTYTVEYNSAKLAPGVYYYKMIAVAEGKQTVIDYTMLK